MTLILSETLAPPRIATSGRSGLSVIYVNRGDFAMGEAELEALLDREHDDAGVNNDLGYLYADQGKNPARVGGR